MRKLTSKQILSLTSLSEQLPSLFSSTMLSVGETATYVDILSQPNAKQDACQQVLLNIFPDGEFQRPHLVDHGDGTFSENFKLIDPCGAHITLYMKKKPGGTEWIETFGQEG